MFTGGSYASVDHVTAKKSADWLFREARAIHSYVMMPHSGMPVWSHFLARVWKTWLYESTGGFRRDDVCNRWVVIYKISIDLKGKYDVCNRWVGYLWLSWLAGTGDVIHHPTYAFSEGLKEGSERRERRVWEGSERRVWKPGLSDLALWIEPGTLA